MSDVTFWEVGGCVRDHFLNKPTKDIDFAVEGVQSFQEMHDLLVDMGFVIHIPKEEFLTIRCGIPDNNPLRERAKDADFVMCRKDSDGSDGRRPDFVEPGTIFDDLARRDFTVNAMAFNPLTGEVLDPHNGMADLNEMELRFVGDPEKRIREDGLRVMRAFRFSVTKGFTFAPGTFQALVSPLAREMLGKVSVERIQIELDKMFKHNMFETLDILCHQISAEMMDVIFRDGLWLRPTLEGK